jgi:hypothetical protein
MIRKSLVFGGITLMVLALTVLVGCPDVVSDDPGGGPTNPNNPNNPNDPDNPGTGTQQDITITAAVATGASVIGIQLTDGKFVAAVQTDDTVKGKFKIKKGDEDFSLGTGATYKLSPDRTVLIITPGTGADTIPATGSLTVTVPSSAIEAKTTGVVSAGTGAAVGLQTAIPAKESAENAVVGHNAIVVTLAAGFFDPGITGANFEHPASGSAIDTTAHSEVEVSSDGKTATIYGPPADAAGKVKIGIKPSALIGYPIVAPSNVTVSSKVVTGQRDIIVPLENAPVVGDNYIKVTLKNGGEFVGNTLPAGNFSLIHPDANPNGILIGTGTVKVSTDKKQAVIKVQTAATTTTAFELNIKKVAFNATTPVEVEDVEVDTLTQATSVVVDPIDTSADTETVLTITIKNGGKFINPAPVVGVFIPTGTETPTFTAVTFNNEKTEAKITLGSDTTDDRTVGVTIPDTAFDLGWLVEPDDITLSLGDE